MIIMLLRSMLQRSQGPFSQGGSQEFRAAYTCDCCSSKPKVIVTRRQSKGLVAKRSFREGSLFIFHAVDANV
jgi:hypothetical protein